MFASQPTHPQRSAAALPRIVALVLGRVERARLQEAIKGKATLELVASGAALEGTVVAHLDTTIGVVAEPFDIEKQPTAPVLARLRASCPGLAIIGYCLPGHAHSAEILALARAGVHELVFRGVDESPLTLQAAFARASHASAAGEVLDALRDVLPEQATRLAERCVHSVRPGFKSRDLARALGISNKTLVQRCRAAGLPLPGALLTWIQLMIVGYLLQVPARSVEQVALSLEFNSPTAMRNVMKRYTGLRPLEVRERGGLRCIIEAFLRPNAYGRDWEGATRKKRRWRVEER